MVEVQAANGGFFNQRTLGGPYWFDEGIGAVVYAARAPDFQDLAAAKTTDRGATWSAANVVEAGTVQGFNSWYERATPGLTDDKIHCSWLDSADSELKHATFDISDGSWSAVNTIDGGITISGTNRDNRTYVTLSRNGNIYVAYVSAGNSSEFFRSTDGGSNWTSRATPWESNAIDHVHLFPASTADDADVAAVFFDASTGATYTIKMYDDSGNSWTESAGWTVTNWDLLAAPHDAGSIRHSDGHIIFASHENVNNAADDLRVFDITADSIASPSVSELTNVFTNVAGAHQAAVMINQQNGDIYVVYIRGTWESAATVYYKVSDDGGSTWSAENTYGEQTDDIRLIHAGLSVGDDGGRFMPAYYDDDGGDIFVSDGNDVEISGAAGPPPATGELVLGTSEGFVGPGADITKSEPSNGTHTIENDSASDWDDLVAKCLEGNWRIQVSAGLTFTQDEDLVINGGTQLYCPDGFFTINGRGYTGAVEHVRFIGDDIFVGNFVIQNSVGLAGQGNNPAACFSLDNNAFSVGLYAFGVDIDSDPDIASMSGDEPEQYHCFDGSAVQTDGNVRNVTMDRCNIQSFVDRTKAWTTSRPPGENHSNTLIGLYRPHYAVDKRAPRCNDDIRFDIVNMVQPDLGVHNIQAGIEIASAEGDTRVDIRGCLIRDNTDNVVSGDIINNDASAKVYYVTSGGDQAVDHSVESGSPIISWAGTNPLTTSQLAAMYSARSKTPLPAAAMDGSLETAILAESSGDYQISVEDAAIDGTVSMSGAGTMSAAATMTYSAKVSMSGVGSMSGNGGTVISGAVSMSGAGTMVAASTVISSGAVVPPLDVAGQTHDITLGGQGFMLAGPLQKSDITSAIPRVSVGTEQRRHTDFSERDTFGQNSFHHGRGEFEISDPLAFFDAENAMTWISRQLTPLPETFVGQLESAGGTDFNGEITDAMPFAGNMYFLVKGDAATDNKVWLWDNTNSEFDEVTDINPDTSSGESTDLHDFDENLYIAQGETVNMRRWSGSGADADNGVPARFLATFDSLLWRADNLNELYHSPDPDQDGTATWTGPIEVGDTSYPIRGMFAGFQGALWVGKDDGIYAVTKDFQASTSGTYVVTKIIDLLPQVSSHNGEAFIEFGGNLYFSAGHSLGRFDGQTIQYMGPDRGEFETGDAPVATFQSGQAGYVRKLAHDGNFLYAAVDSEGVNSSFVALWTGTGWHKVAEAGGTSRVQSVFHTGPLAQTGVMQFPLLWWNHGASGSGATFNGDCGRGSQDAATSITVTGVTQVGTGQLMVASVFLNANETESNFIAPVGWAKIGYQNSALGTQAVYFREKQAGDNNPVFQWSTSSAASFSLRSYTGHDASDPIDSNVSTDTTSAATTHDIPSVTTTVANTRVVAILDAIDELTTSTGATNPTITPVIGQDWTNESNIAASDDSRATTSISPAAGKATAHLRAQGFGFNIPVAATIQGIKVDIEKSHVAASTPSVDFVNSASAQSYGGAASIRIPTGTRAGDITVAVITPTTNSGNYTIPAGSGWTLLGVRNAGFNGSIVAFVSKQWEAGETIPLDQLIFFSSAYATHRVSAATYRGANGIANFSMTGSTGSTTGAPTFSGLSGNWRVVQLIGKDHFSGDASTTPDANWTEREDFPTNFEKSWIADHATGLSTSDAGPQTHTASIAWAQMTILLNPYAAVRDSSVRLIDATGNLISSSNKAESSNWGTSDATSNYGSATDLWNTGGTLTPTVVNDPDFGVALSALVGDGATARVDHVQMTVWYVSPTELTPPASWNEDCDLTSHNPEAATGTFSKAQASAGASGATTATSAHSLDSNVTVFAIKAGDASQIRYMKLPRFSENPLDDADLTYEDTTNPVLITGWFDAGLPDVLKTFFNVVIEGENIIDDRTVGVEFQVDNDDIWYRLGSISFAKPLATLTFPDNGSSCGGLSATRIRYRLTLTQSASCCTPVVLRSWAHRFVVRPEARFGWVAPIKAHNNLTLLNREREDQTAASIRYAAYSLRQKENPFLLLTGDDPAARTNFVENPSFEVADNQGIPTGFTPVGSATVRQNAQYKTHGTYSCEVAIPTVAVGSVHGIFGNSQVFTQGDIVTVACDIFLKGITFGTAVKVTLEKTDGTQVAFVNPRNLMEVDTEHTNFERVQAAYTVQAASEELRWAVYFTADTEDRSGTILVDSAEMILEPSLNDLNHEFFDGDSPHCLWLDGREAAPFSPSRQLEGHLVYVTGIDEIFRYNENKSEGLTHNSDITIQMREVH